MVGVVVITLLSVCSSLVESSSWMYLETNYLAHYYNNDNENEKIIHILIFIVQLFQFFSNIALKSLTIKVMQGNNVVIIQKYFGLHIQVVWEHD